MLLFAVAETARAGLRTRELPDVPDGVEAELTTRAATSSGRMHAVLRVPREGRAVATRAGVELLHSIDGDLFLASLPAASLATGSPPSGVAAAWDLLATDRMEPGLRERLAGAVPEPLSLRVKAFADVPLTTVRAAIEGTGARVVREIGPLGILEIEVLPGAVESIAARDDVRWIERTPPPGEVALAGLRFDARVDQVQSLGLAGSGVVIGMWDNGRPDAHPDLAGRVTSGEAGMWVMGHATHVAGIAIGDGTNSASQGWNPLQWRGVATGAELVVYDLADPLAEVDSAIALHGIDVSTNSWVFPVDGSNCQVYGDYANNAPEYDAIVCGVYGKLLPVVFAAGNERDDADCAAWAPEGYRTLGPPATAKNVISVGAHLSDVLHMTSFSSWGPTDDGRMKPDMTAAGCQTSGDFGITSTTIAGGYLALCGTSMSAPAVTGAIALLIADWRAFFPGDPRPATHKALLGGFAMDRGPAGVDYRFGLGAIDVEASVRALRTATTVEDEVGDLGTDEWTFFVPAGTETLRVTLAWDDPPGAELADTTLVNDLDLELVGPVSGVHLPFVLDPADPAALAVPGVNRLDNVEQVRLLAPEAGAWLARVRGTNVPLAPQTYSLVGFDTRPPADPAALAATAVDDTTVALTWIRPGDSDRAGTLVVRSTSPIVWSPADGTTYAPGTEPSPGVVVVANGDVDHSGTPLVDAPLPPGTLWHYALFSRDEIPNWSVGVGDTARTGPSVVAAPEPAAPAGLRFARIGSNPAAGPSTFRLELPLRAPIDVAVFDAAGRHVASIARGERDAGSHVLVWDGRDGAGTPVAAGVYFVRMKAPGLVTTEKVVRIR